MVSLTRRLLLLTIIACCAAPGAARAAAKEVLLIGNSYTFLNNTNMDQLLQSIARAAGEKINVTREAVGGYTLNDHWHRSQTQKTLDSRHWDLVILQEYSLVPGNEHLRKNVMLPAVDRFYRKIAARNSHLMLLMTWGRKKGIDTTFLDEHIHFKDYASMQEAVRQGYEEVGRAYHLPVAPAGLAWKAMREKYPDVGLYQSDGTHPTLDGSYLAALTLYGAIYGRSPLGVTWRPSAISRSTADKLRQAAAAAFTKSLAAGSASGAPGSRVKVSVLASGLAACREWGFSLECDPAQAAIVGVQRGRHTAAWPTLTLGVHGGMTRIFARQSATGAPLSGNQVELCTLTVQVKGSGGLAALTPRYATEGAAYCLVSAGTITEQAERSAVGEWVVYE